MKYAIVIFIVVNIAVLGAFYDLKQRALQDIT